MEAEDRNEKQPKTEGIEFDPILYLHCKCHSLEKQTYYFLGVVVGIIIGCIFLRGD